MNKEKKYPCIICGKLLTVMSAECCDKCMNDSMDDNEKAKKKKALGKDKAVQKMSDFLTDAESVKIVKCCKCKLKHPKGERVGKDEGAITTYLCPKCGEESYFDCKSENQ